MAEVGALVARWPEVAAGPVWPVADLAGFVVGVWSLERDLADADGGVAGSFTGEARFTPGEGEVWFREEGELVLGSHRAPAHRALRYQLDGEAGALVYFDHGGFFHELDLGSGRCQARHPCRDDLYSGEFVVCGRDEWWQRWSVAGPTKNHVLTTRLRRVG